MAQPKTWVSLCQGEGRFSEFEAIIRILGSSCNEVSSSVDTTKKSHQNVAIAHCNGGRIAINARSVCCLVSHGPRSKSSICWRRVARPIPAFLIAKLHQNHVQYRPYGHCTSGVAGARRWSTRAKHKLPVRDLPLPNPPHLVRTLRPIPMYPSP